MSKISHKDFNCLLNIIDSIEKIESYTSGYASADEFNNDVKSFDATMMNFIVIGEMAEKLSEDLISETQAQIEWFKIRGFRNIIAHNYFGIDAEEVWQIINTNLKSLEIEIRKLTN